MKKKVSMQDIIYMEENSYFDVILFTDANGIDYASDGRTSDVTHRVVYRDGINGSSGNEVVFNPHFFDETMVCFYAPVRFEGRIIGVLRGAFLAEEYLKNMLTTTYFGEDAQVFLCAPDDRVIAGSDGKSYNGHLLDTLTAENMIAKETSAGIQLEILLVVMFVVYIAIIIIRAGRRRKQLENQKREMGYIISGVNTMFTR